MGFKLCCRPDKALYCFVQKRTAYLDRANFSSLFALSCRGKGGAGVRSYYAARVRPRADIRTGRALLYRIATHARIEKRPAEARSREKSKRLRCIRSRQGEETSS